MTLPPEPPIGSEVVDRHDVRWEHVEGAYGNHYWLRSPDGDPESWTRVCEFGPLRLAWITASMEGGEAREVLRPLTWVDPAEFVKGPERTP